MRSSRRGIICLALTVLLSVSLTQDFRPESRALDAALLKALPKLKTGDIVLRQGLGADSVLIAKVSHSRFSHAGMIAAVYPEVTVIHAAPSDDPLKPDQVIASTLTEFAAHAERLSIRRYPLDEKARQGVSAYLYSMLGTPFVLDGRRESIYCATLLREALKPYLSVKELEFHYLKLPLFSGWYLFPEDFVRDQRSTLIFQTYGTAESDF